MAKVIDWLREPRGAGLVCASAAVILGMVYLFMAGAPGRHLAINGAAWVVGLAAFATVTVPRWRLGAAREAILPGLALLLLAVALMGTPVEGAARWAVIGPLSLQVSLIVLPAMIVAFARAPGPVGAAAMGLAAVALALQPDRGMAGVLVAGMAMLAVLRPERNVLAALAFSLAGFAATMAQADTLPAVPFVDQILFTAFAVHPLAGAAVVGGAVLLLVPAFWGRGTMPLVFGAIWGAVVLAAALGHYPTPVVGYGGSAIVGYLLSLAMMPRQRAGAGMVAQGARGAPERGDRRLFAAT